MIKLNKIKKNCIAAVILTIEVTSSGCSSGTSAGHDSFDRNKTGGGRR